MHACGLAWNVLRKAVGSFSSCVSSAGYFGWHLMGGKPIAGKIHMLMSSYTTPQHSPLPDTHGTCRALVYYCVCCMDITVYNTAFSCQVSQETMAFEWNGISSLIRDCVQVRSGLKSAAWISGDAVNCIIQPVELVVARAAHGLS